MLDSTVGERFTDKDLDAGYNILLSTKNSKIRTHF